MSSNDNDLYVGCKAYQPGVSTSYGYIPSQSAGIAFCALFGISMAVHIIQFCWKRTWWCSLFSIGCMVEVLGWAGRLWAAECPYNSTAFMIQISTLIIAPTFFTAGIYVLLGHFIRLFGRESSMLSPKRYLWIFCTCDIVSLIIQAAGGGLASSESNEVNGDTSLGTNIMVAGIVFQLASLTIFVVCAVDFFRRSIRLGYLRALIKGPLLYLLGAMVLSVVCIYIRSIYRTIELAQGWTGYLITHQTYFIVLDGVMMVIAVVVFNIFHPGWLLPSDMVFVVPKDQVAIDLGDPEAQQLHSSTEYTGYGHR